MISTPAPSRPFPAFLAFPPDSYLMRYPLAAAVTKLLAHTLSCQLCKTLGSMDGSDNCSCVIACLNQVQFETGVGRGPGWGWGWVRVKEEESWGGKGGFGAVRRTSKFTGTAQLMTEMYLCSSHVQCVLYACLKVGCRHSQPPPLPPSTGRPVLLLLRAQ